MVNNFGNNHPRKDFPSAVPIVIGWLSFLGGIIALFTFHEEWVIFDNFITDWISLSLLILGILSYGTLIAYGTYIVYPRKPDSLYEDHHDDQPQDMGIDDQLAKEENELLKEVDELLRNGDINDENIDSVNEKLKSLEGNSTRMRLPVIFVDYFYNYGLRIFVIDISNSCLFRLSDV